MTSTPDPTRVADPEPSSGGWARAGLVAGIAGLATSQLTAELLSVRDTPYEVVLGAIIAITPGEAANAAVEVLATIGKPALLFAVVGLVVASFAVAGRLWRRSLWAALPVWVGLAVLDALVAVAVNGFGAAQLWPSVVALVTWLVAMGVLHRVLSMRDESAGVERATPAGELPGPLPGRRGVLAGFGLVAFVAAVAATGVTLLDRRQAVVQGSRRLLRIPGVTRPEPPSGVLSGIEGLASWQTPNDDFFVVHSALTLPALEAREWVLRIHGRVQNPVELTYDDLLARGMSEAWVTLGCVTNELGGDQVGNAWWSGVLTRDLLAVARPLEGAEAVLQTSVDGWTCLTPLEAMTDDRDSLLAVAMNGEPLPMEHGFPVRTVVPGLFGYTSACKWVVDWEVTTFDDATSDWIERGWALHAPARLSSRIDVPAQGVTVPAGDVRVAGMAWHQGVGISRVEVALDGGPWEPVTLAGSAGNATWVQWTGQVEVSEGEHVLRVRAVNRDGATQTGVPSEARPDGATGWHEVTFTAEAPAPG